MVEYRSKFQFGDEVEDVITEFVGIITDIAFYKYGCTQCIVQPPAKDGEQKEHDSIDEPQLKIIKESEMKGRPKRNIDGIVKYKGKFGFGDKVEDKITGFIGVITAVNFNLNGIKQYLIQPPAKDGEQKESDFINEKQLKLLIKSGEPKPKPRNGGKRKHPKRK